MTLAEVRDLLDADVVVGEDMLDREVHTAFGADLMSDVLAFARTGCILVTGLANLQAVRTAFALDIAAIVICRGKVLAGSFVETARDLGIPVLWTSLIMFETCGRLHQAGITGCIREIVAERMTGAGQPS